MSFIFTLFDDVGETMVVPFCKWPVCSLRIVVVDAFVRVAVWSFDVRFVVTLILYWRDDDGGGGGGEEEGEEKEKKFHPTII